MTRRAPVQLPLLEAALSAHPPQSPWVARNARPLISAESFTRLGWEVPATHAGDSPGLKTRRKSVTVYALTVRELLGRVEQEEVERRARRIEREFTEALAVEVGWVLVRGRKGHWRAQRHRLDASQGLLEADSAQQLREQLHRLRPDPAPDVPWGNSADAQVVAHVG